MTTKPEAIAQIEALRAAAVQIQQCDFAGWGNTCNDAADYIAVQDAEIARLREASGDPLQGAVDWLLEADREFLCVATVQRTLRIGYNRAQRLCDKAKESAALTTKGTE